jgi:hypothetical protein
VQHGRFSVLSESEVQKWRGWVASGRVVRGGQEGIVGAVEGRGVHQRHLTGSTEASRLHPRDALLRATGGISTPERRRRRDAPSPSPSGRRSPAGSLYRGESFRAIARRLERSASTVCRELNRNGARTRYRAQKAEEQAWQSVRPPKRCLLLATNRFLRDAVARKLLGRSARPSRSPEQISGWLEKEYPLDEAMRMISHETI